MKFDDLIDLCWRVGALLRGPHDSTDAEVVDRQVRRALRRRGRGAAPDPSWRWWHHWPARQGGGGICAYNEPCEYTYGARKLVRDMQLCPRHRWEMGLADATERRDI
jgi:hypothetical protein